MLHLFFSVLGQEVTYFV